MKKIFIHTWWMSLELIRQPSYFVATIAFPSLFYVIFAIPESKTPGASNMLLASFSCFAVFGVLFLQFGVGVAQERSTSWYHYLRTMPLHSFHLIAARFLTAYIFSALSVIGLVVLALLYTEVQLTSNEWLLYAGYLILGGFPFCVMGLVLGYFSGIKAALPIGHLIYLPLSFAGGLWKPPELLPKSLNEISIYLPTRQFGEVLWSTVKSEPVPSRAIHTLLIYLIISGVTAYFGFQKDYSKRYL